MNKLQSEIAHLNEENSFDLYAYLKRILRSWHILILSFLLCFAVAWAYLKFVALPTYYIDAKVLIEDSEKGGGQTGFLEIADVLGTKSSVNNEAVVLKTKRLMEILVTNLKLNVVWFSSGVQDVELFESPFLLIQPKVNGEFKSFELILSNFKGRKFDLSYVDQNGDEVLKNGVSYDEVFTIPGSGIFAIGRTKKEIKTSDYKVVVSKIDDTVDKMRKALTAEITNKGTSIIDLELSHTIPAKGEYILTNYIEEFVRQNIKDKSRIADSTIKFIDNRILLVNAELNSIEGSIQSFMQTKGLANLSSQSQITLQNNSAANRDLLGLETQLSVTDMLIDFLNERNNKSIISSVIISDDSRNDQSFNLLAQSYNELVLNRERLLLSNTADNPIVKNVDKRIETTRDNIIDYLRNNKMILGVRKNNIKANLNNFSKDINSLPGQQRAYLDLTRQQELKQDLYLFLLKKREETALANTSNIAGIRVIDPPKSEQLPFSPKRPIIWAVAFVLSLLIPVGKIYLDDLMNVKVRNKKDVQKRTKIPIVAELSHREEGADLIEFKDARSAIAEQFRALRTNMQFLLTDQDQKVMLVTSSISGEGKSFTSLNLANICAVSGKKVLLLEFDLRKPKLSKTYVNKNGLGISNYIVNKKLTLDDFIVPIEGNETLFFGACGPVPPNPSELIMNPRVKEMFEEARQRFDYIIVDAPPVGLVTDAQLLYDYSDLAIYVVRAGYTPHEILELPEDIRKEGKMDNMVIVLNDISESAGGAYGYGYGYGYYHNDDKKAVKNRFWKWWS